MQNSQICYIIAFGILIKLTINHINTHSYKVIEKILKEK